MAPKQLGPYRIVGTLGRGGMGTVYRAVNGETDEPAAVKILSASLADDSDFRRRFEGEIETLRKLRHPNIVRLFGFGEEEGRLFYAMELVEGDSLEQELHAGRRFDWREVAGIGLDMCRALRHAHDRGVIHRDIKPANLLLTEDGHVKLSDFGIARLFGYSRLTAAGSVIGTIDYMAPEQADARPTGPRTDLYSLGGVLYTLLAGRPPFQAKSLVEMLAKQRDATADRVGKHVKDVPVELENTIARLLEKDPEDRFATAMVLGRRLEALIARPVSEDSLPAAAANEFDVGQTDLSAEPSAEKPLPVTRQATHAGGLSVEDDSPDAKPEALPETRETSALANLPAAEGGDATSSTNPKTASHFVRVEEEELDRHPIEEPERGALISVQTWVLVLGLVLVALAAWYFLQDPPADGLYEQIIAVTGDGSVSSYRRAKDDIRRFTELYSDDPRAAGLRDCLHEIELDDLEGEFERSARGLVDAGRLLPIEHDYLEAIKYMRLNPEQGIAKLQALVELYDRPEGDAGPTGQCLTLAKRRLANYRVHSAHVAADRLGLISKRLDEADAVAESDPDRARRMREAVIELYEQKPWAADAVQRARQAVEDGRL